MKATASDIDLARRWLLAAGTGGAAASLGGFSLPGRAQANVQAKPLPPVAAFKDADRLIVHSANGIETRRSAFGTSGITDIDALFLRNNANPPSESIVADPDAWQVQFGGVVSPRALTVAELKRIGLASVAMVLQCSGNGRGFFEHNPSGSPWTVGAAGNTLWSGVPLRDVVQLLGGVQGGMRYMTSTGGESFPAGIDPKTVVVERSVPWTEVENAILAWELNGRPIPLAHGGPLRLIVPGYYGVNHIKYVKSVVFTRDETAANIQTSSYRVREIGAKGNPTQPSMWQMNLKSFVTHPTGTGEPLRAGLHQVHGVAFSGESPVKAVEISADGGSTWHTAQFFGPDLGRHAWRQFMLPVTMQPGSYLFTSRAIAADGSVQPELRIENERGYAHNGWRDHGVAVIVV